MTIKKRKEIYYLDAVVTGMRLRPSLETTGRRVAVQRAHELIAQAKGTSPSGQSRSSRTRSGRSGVTSSTSENSILLSQAFFEEIDKHRVPVEREVVAALANAPGVLELYLWLVWKTWSLSSDTLRIPLFLPVA
jgi:replication initiator protein